jgi:signal transduction histidine kinase
VARASAVLGDATRRIGEGEVVTSVDVPAGEFADLARRLQETSEKLDAARRRERALDLSRRELIAWVSHDLRTPLAGIRAMAEALEDGIVDDAATVERYHRAMRIETDRLAGLVDDLFELSRINAGALRLQMERASLGDLVSDAIATASVTAESRGVRLQGRLTTEAPEVDLSVPDMARVLRNLLENAIRHTPSDGAVVVEAGVEAEHAYVSVADTCGGIPEPDIGRVFDVAFRGASARTPDDGGAGLGLAIARGIVQAHHGQINVCNEGSGCRFTVRLPLDATKTT